MLVYDQIEKIIFKSALDANDRYIDWTGGEASHDAGIELLIKNRVAERLMATHDGGYVLVDSPFFKVRRKALKGGRKGTKTDDPRRAGVLLFNRRNQAIVAIEVKRSFTFSNIKDDIDKLKALLLRHGHFRGGTLKAGYSVSIRELQAQQRQSTKQAVRSILARLRRMRGMERIYVKSRISTPRKRRIGYAADSRRIRIDGFQAVLIRLTLRRPRS
jgi:hypothetical protein